VHDTVISCVSNKEKSLLGMVVLLLLMQNLVKMLWLIVQKSHFF